MDRGPVAGRGGRSEPEPTPVRAAARAHAEIAASRRSLGRPILEADCQIAAIARARDAAVATRNAGDFTDCGIVVIDPWTAGPTAP